MIDFQNVSFSYGEESSGGGIRNVNLTINTGEFVLLTGESGCGKTTITRLVNGLVPHYYEGNLEGDVLLDGKSVSDTPLYDLAAMVGSVFQNPKSQFFNVDTDSELAFACENLGYPQEDILKRIQEGGVVGQGGAGFPTCVKLKPAKPVDTILLNGCECEPLLTADHRVLLEYADDIIFGLKAVLKTTGAEKGIIVIEDNKPDAIELMQKKVADIGNMEVFVARTKYPQGAEKTLIKRVMGRIVPSGGLPADVGVVVDNISTVKAISDAIQTGMPLIERVATVTGEKIKNPGNFVIKIGTSVRELIDYCGGFTDDDVLVKMGGPMMGFPLNTLDVPMMKGSNGIIAVEPDETKEQPCIKCGRCVDVCPMELSPLYFVKYAKDENWQGMKDMNVMDCVECRCCQYICSSKIPIINSIKAGKNAVRGMK